MDVKNAEKSSSAGAESQQTALLPPLLSALATLIEEMRNANALQADLVSSLLEQNAQLMQAMLDRDDDQDEDEDEDSFTDLEGNPIKVS